MAPVSDRYGAGFRDFLRYDPAYSWAGVPCADPDTVDEVLSSSLTPARCPRLAGDQAVPKTWKPSANWPSGSPAIRA